MGRNVTALLIAWLACAVSPVLALTLQSLGSHYPPTTVAGLAGYATPVRGTLALVTDANAGCVAGQIPVGGGSTPCQVAFDGANWRELRGINSNTPQSNGGAADWRMHDGQTYNSTTLAADGACSSSSGTFTSSTGSFTSGDVGKILVIGCADGSTTGPGAVAEYCSPLIGTVSTVNSATSVNFASLAVSSGGTGQTSCATSVSSAKWYIGTNNRAAIQACLAAGNCSVVAAGTYGAVGGIQWTTSNGSLTCSAGTLLFDPMHGNASGSEEVSSWMILHAVTGNTITGCTFQGTDKFGVYDARDNVDWFVNMGGPTGGASSNTVTNSHFSQGWGDCAIDIGGDNPNPTSNNNQVTHNTFDTMGLFDFAILNGNNNVFAFNSETNTGPDIEPDTSLDETYSNQIHDNTVTTTSSGRNNVYSGSGCTSVNQSYNTANGCMAVALYQACAVSNCSTTETGGATQMYNINMTGPYYVYCSAATILSGNTKSSGAGGNGVSGSPLDASPCAF